jgi:hypothetical protein
MKKLLLVPFLLIFCGCSGIDGRAYYSIVPDQNLCKARTDDWVEDLTEPSFGVICPPLYALNHGDTDYIFYPTMKRIRFVSIGPAFLPVIPIPRKWLGGHPGTNDEYKLSIRCYSESGPVVQSSPNLTITDNGTILSCVNTNNENSDVKGVRFTYELDQAIGTINNFNLRLLLPDGSERTVRYALKRTLWICPLFSFNEPPKKPFIEILKKD